MGLMRGWAKLVFGIEFAFAESLSIAGNLNWREERGLYSLAHREGETTMARLAGSYDWSTGMANDTA